MGKILLTEDYSKIVKRGFLLPNKDLIKFYDRVKEKHLSKNPDMFIELKSMINDYLDWYKGQVIGGTVPVELPDGTIKYFDKNQTWESDGDGDYTKWVKHDLFEQTIFLFHLSVAKNVRVNKPFFENHLRIIEEIERQEEIKKLDIKINILERISQNIEVQISKSKQTLTGFESSLTDQQIKILYSKMNGIYFEATPDNFKAIFKNEPLPPDCSIKWIDKGTTRHEPNKQTLFEFLYLLKEYEYLEKSNFDTTSTNDNNLYRKLETIFPGFKNFPASNPQTTQKNTPRQKSLETIVLSLKS